MPFLSPKNKTAPKIDPDLPWPIDGLAYVITFMGPMSAGLSVGAIVKDWKIALLGLLMGTAITYLNGWLCDKFLEPWVARHQQQLQSGAPRILINIVAFAWAIALCAFSIIAPFALLGSEALTHIR
ncbi:MAG: hypothetical protein RBU21_22035 [FCB group bacterium]|jgi:hypothetical protein|nr:hypothetical protein [FCB group bacterium]